MTLSNKAIFLGVGLGVLSTSGIAFAQEDAIADTPPTTETAAAPAAEPAAVESEVEAPTPTEEPTPEPTPEEEPAGEDPEELAEETSTAPPEEAPAAGYLDPKFNIGTGLRVGYTFDTNVPDDNFAHVMGTNIRPYMMGQVSKHIKFEANLDSYFANVGTDVVASIRVLDAVIKLELDPLVNFWVGRFLPPSDRANLSGPYFQNQWNYPVNTNLFPAIYAGRHDGAAYWGQIKDGMLKWQLGIFDATYDDNPLFAGRVVLNLLEPEGGYYNSSTYYGTKDVLAIAGTIQYQDGGDTATGTGIDGLAAEVDVLFEKTFGSSGTLDVEGAYYNFTGTDQGQSFSAVLSYLLPGKQGPGTFQPSARLQMMFPDAGDSYPTIDGSLNYIVDGHNCRFTLNYQHVGKHDAVDNDDLITLGGQIQMF